MSPKPGTPIDKTWGAPGEPVPEIQKPEEPKVVPAATETPRPMTIMTESDAYISERMKGQPKTLSEIEVTKREEKLGISRLSLHDYFEPFSYDCTRGISCSHHGWNKEEIHFGLETKMDRWTQTKHGKFVFRWLNQKKQALDHAINARGWYLVNRSLFPEAPSILFSVNGGVEEGDSILGFMPVSRAVEIRNKPSKDSLDRVNSEAKRHETNPNFYKAKLDSENADPDFAPADALLEGRDF